SKSWNGLKEPMSCILYILLNLSLLPARCRIAEVWFKQIMTSHGLKADIDVTLFASTDLVDGCAHIIIDAASWNATKHTEGMIMGIKQHLMGLCEIGANDKGSGIT